MLYMVIEDYRNGPELVYARAAASGRMLPDGLRYLDSWVVDNASLDRCYQLMEADDPVLFEEWCAHWQDLVSFEIVPVIPSRDAAARFHPTRPDDTLSPDTVAVDPVVQFQRWYDDAVAAGVRQPDAMTLATAGPDRAVSARTVLLRGVDARGFVFYTNLESAKAGDLDANPRAALVFHWRELERQVRVVGPVTHLDVDEATRYWASRPRGHRLSAWASPQSASITADALDARLTDVEAWYRDVEPPLPPFWGGYVVGVDELELWQGQRDRLHDRVVYRRAANGSFTRERLAP